MSDPTDNESEVTGPNVSSTRPAPVEYRPLSVSISDETRAQLQVIAQLRNHPLKEETRLAMEHWVELSKNDPELRKLAERVQGYIEREAARKEREAEAKRNAFASFFGADDTIVAPEGPHSDESPDADEPVSDADEQTDNSASAAPAAKRRGRAPSPKASADA